MASRAPAVRWYARRRSSKAQSCVADRNRGSGFSILLKQPIAMPIRGQCGVARVSPSTPSLAAARPARKCVVAGQLRKRVGRL